MHEVSLVHSVLNSLEEQFSPEELENLSQIDLAIGVFSNVEPLLMKSAFKAVQDATGKYAQVKLEIESVPIKIYCETCRKETLIENYVFVCGHCKQPNSNLIQGTEMLIRRVHFDG